MKYSIGQQVRAKHFVGYRRYTIQEHKVENGEISYLVKWTAVANSSRTQLKWLPESSLYEIKPWNETKGKYREIK